MLDFLKNRVAFLAIKPNDRFIDQPKLVITPLRCDSFIQSLYFVCWFSWITNSQSVETNREQETQYFVFDAKKMPRAKTLTKPLSIVEPGTHLNAYKRTNEKKIDVFLLTPWHDFEFFIALMRLFQTKHFVFV